MGVANVCYHMRIPVANEKTWVVHVYIESSRVFTSVSFDLRELCNVINIILVRFVTQQINKGHKEVKRRIIVIE